MDVLKTAKRLRPETAVVMITAHGSEKIAVEAMKAGAEDYIPKPFDNDEMRVVVARALDRYRLQRENRLLLEQIQREYGFEIALAEHNDIPGFAWAMKTDPPYFSRNSADSVISPLASTRISPDSLSTMVFATILPSKYSSGTSKALTPDSAINLT